MFLQLPAGLFLVVVAFDAYGWCKILVVPLYSVANRRHPSLSACLRTGFRELSDRYYVVACRVATATICIWIVGLFRIERRQHALARLLTFFARASILPSGRVWRAIGTRRLLVFDFLTAGTDLLRDRLFRQKRPRR